MLFVYKRDSEELKSFSCKIHKDITRQAFHTGSFSHLSESDPAGPVLRGRSRGPRRLILVLNARVKPGQGDFQPHFSPEMTADEEDPLGCEKPVLRARRRAMGLSPSSSNQGPLSN